MRLQAIVVGLTLGLMAGPALAADSVLQVVATPEATLRYEEGLAFLLSQKPASGVFLGIDKGVVNGNNRAVLVLGVENLGAAAITVDPSALTVIADGKPVKVLTADFLEQEARKRAGRKEFAAKLAAAGSVIGAASAGPAYSSTRYSGAIQPFGRPSVDYSGTMNTTTTNPLASAIAKDMAMARGEQSIARTQATGRAQIADSRTGGFLSQTVDAGDSYMTYLTLDRLPSNAQTVVVKVTFGSEVHEFNFKVQK